jgi:hypothetical protein
VTAPIIAETFQQLYGQPRWGVHYHRQLNLSMNFGQPSLKIREPYESNAATEKVRRLMARRNVTFRGEWWLWIYCCFWRLSSGDVALAAGSSSLRRIERAMAELDGQELVSVTVDPRTGATGFRFDLGGALDCRRFGKESDAALWTLYKPDGYVLSVYGNETFSHQPGSAKEEELQPIEARDSVLRPS